MRYCLSEGRKWGVGFVPVGSAVLGHPRVLPAKILPKPSKIAVSRCECLLRSLAMLLRLGTGKLKQEASCEEHAYAEPFRGLRRVKRDFGVSQRPLTPKLLPKYRDMNERCLPYKWRCIYSSNQKFVFPHVP